jgi:hypothetical protein
MVEDDSCICFRHLITSMREIYMFVSFVGFKRDC